MGVLTHVQLVSEALELAGNTGLSSRAQVWLGLVLRNLFEKFTIPQQVSLLEAGALTPGTGVYQAGGVGALVFAGLPVRGIRRILLTSPTGSSERELAVINGANFEAGELSLAPTVGQPQRVFVTAEVDSFLLLFDPKPDQAYLAVVTADTVPAAPLVYNASSVNLWPDDLTVIQGIYALALKHQQDERAASEWSIFEDMMKKDRVRYGNLNRDNSKVALGGPHRLRTPSNRGPGWMGPV